MMFKRILRKILYKKQVKAAEDLYKLPKVTQDVTLQILKTNHPECYEVVKAHLDDMVRARMTQAEMEQQKIIVQALARGDHEVALKPLDHHAVPKPQLPKPSKEDWAASAHILHRLGAI